MRPPSPCHLNQEGSVGLFVGGTVHIYMFNLYYTRMLHLVNGVIRALVCKS